MKIEIAMKMTRFSAWISCACLRKDSLICSVLHLRRQSHLALLIDLQQLHVDPDHKSILPQCSRKDLFDSTYDVSVLSNQGNWCHEKKQLNYEIVFLCFATFHTLVSICTKWQI